MSGPVVTMTPETYWQGWMSLGAGLVLLGLMLAVTVGPVVIALGLMLDRRLRRRRRFEARS